MMGGLPLPMHWIQSSRPFPVSYLPNSPGRGLSDAAALTAGAALGEEMASVEDCALHAVSPIAAPVAIANHRIVTRGV